MKTPHDIDLAKELIRGYEEQYCDAAYSEIIRDPNKQCPVCHRHGGHYANCVLEQREALKRVIA